MTINLLVELISFVEKIRLDGFGFYEQSIEDFKQILT